MSDMGELKPSLEQMRSWLILEGWQAYNHRDDQSWDQWGFSKDGKSAWFLFSPGGGDAPYITSTGVAPDEIPFPLSSAPEADLDAFCAFIREENFLGT